MKEGAVQSEPWRRKEGIVVYFEDNAGVIVNIKGEMKGTIDIVSTLSLNRVCV